MMTSRAPAAAVGVTLALVGGITVPRLLQGPDAPAPGGAAHSSPAPAEADRTTEVERILGELRAGSIPPSAPSDDNPVAGVSDSLLAGFATPVESIGPLGRVAIPAIGLDVDFFPGVHDEVLRQGPGHWPATPVPGTAGNAVLSGHRTTFTRPFGDLDRLRPGDEIRTTVGAHSTSYRVERTDIVAEDRYAAVVLAQPGDPSARTVTLFACHPKGSRRERIVVRAVAGRGDA